MSSYRPNRRHNPPLHFDSPPPPPPSAMPPLPRGPVPPYEAYRKSDSWRPQGYTQYGSVPSSDFSFQNGSSAPRYPLSSDSYRPGRPLLHAVQEVNRPRRDHYWDTRNLNRPKRGQLQHSSRGGSHFSANTRALMKHQEDEDVPRQMLGVTADGEKFMPAADISDSDEEEMDESDSDHDHNDVKRLHLEDQADGEIAEPPSKRRAVGNTLQDWNEAESVPKWSNPDPYTVLPPMDDSQRKKKDPVKIIRKALRPAERREGEKNQIVANDDFISFNIEENDASDDVESMPDNDANPQQTGWPGVPDAPTGPRQFSHLENLHKSRLQKAPGTGNSVSAVSLGPPPGLPNQVHKTSVEVVLDVPFEARVQFNKGSVIDLTQGNDASLGSRKRTYDDQIKVAPKGKLGRKNGPTGSLLQEWTPGTMTDPTPWLKRTGVLTENAGFRLHKEICDFYEFVRPQNFEQTVREELLSRLQSVVRREIQDCSVHCFGSFAAGIYLPNADMDLVVMSDKFRSSGKRSICQSNNHLRRFGQFIEYSGIAQADSVQVIAHAKVPLVKFVDRITAIKVDVSFENDTGIIANDTFAAWKRQYPAMPILITVIKQFLMMRGLNEVMTGGLGGFSVTCLVTSVLQNMPRVQIGELIPEQHLGEILLEFLDLYGSRLDTTRTGITMNPSGYFEKVHNRPGLRGPVYQANKPDRLAIIDPNNLDNDISGGSHNVMSIFDRFAQAHSEILKAMKTPNRPSLLDWSLGGDYESFVWQRNHLLNLYKEKWGTPEPLPADAQDCSQGQGHSFPGISQPLSEQGLSAANGQNSGHDLKAEIGLYNTGCTLSSTLAKVPNKIGQNGEMADKQSLAETTSNAKKGKESQRLRAENFKRKYPEIGNVPSRLSLKKRKGLLNSCAANRGLMPTAEKKERNSQVSRAQDLKKRFPDMSGIPDMVDRAMYKILVAELSAKSAPVSGVLTSNTAQPSAVLRPHVSAVPTPLPMRPPPPIHKYPMRLQAHPLKEAVIPDPIVHKHPARQMKSLNGTAVSEQGRPWTRKHKPNSELGRKMAPPTDARRAEVARSLMGNSNDDPIQLD